MADQLERTFLSAIEENQHKLFRICSVYSRNEEDSKDLFQEVLVNIWQALPSYESRSSIGTWMFRITLNVCLRFRSRHNRKMERFINMDSVTISKIGMGSDTNESDDRIIILRNCIRALNEADRAVIALYLEELPYKEISNITGLKVNTVAVKVKRIKEKLLNCLNGKL